MPFGFGFQGLPQQPQGDPNAVQGMGMGGFAPSQSNNVYLPAFNVQNYGQNKDFLNALAQEYKKRNIGGDARAGQMDLVGMLQAQTRGEGPSVAREQMKLAQDRNLSQALGAQQAVGGTNAGLSRRLISQERALGGQSIAAESAALRAQEQLSAQQQLGAALSDVRNLDIGAEALNDQMVQYFTSQGLSLDMAQSQANMELQRMLSENYNQTAATMASIGNSIRSAKAQKYSAPWGILSDERLKKNVKDSSDTLKGFLDTVSTLRSLPSVRGTVAKGLTAVGEKATATGSPIIGSVLGDAGQAIANPTGYLKGKAMDSAVGNALSSLRGGGVPDSGEKGGGAASMVASSVGGIISGARPHAADRQNYVPVQGTLRQGSTSPKYAVADTGNEGEIPQNSGIIGAIISALASGVSMKENIAPADDQLSSFLSSFSQPSSTGARYGVEETAQPKRYSQGILEKISDEKKKKNMDETSLRDFLNALKAYEYDYKNPELDGQGRQIGVMAQDLEKTPIGKQFVMETPRGKMVDYGKGFAAILASQAMLNKRVNALEGNGD